MIYRDGNSTKEQEIEIVQGSHVYYGEGDSFVEWADLTGKQKQGVLEAMETAEAAAYASMRSSMQALKLPTAAESEAKACARLIRRNERRKGPQQGGRLEV